MTEQGSGPDFPRTEAPRGDEMRTPDEVTAMLRLWSLGWGAKRIAAELKVSRNTEKRYIGSGGWAAYRKPKRPKVLDGYEAWLAERMRRHRGNADVVRQDLARELGLEVSLRTVERAVAALRQDLQAQARATVRFETPPGRQLQIDFGETRVEIGGEPVRVYLFVATLGWSRRCYVQAFRHERQSAWFDGVEGAFAYFGGIPSEVLLDNARALVDHHDAATREVRFNERLLAFARYWAFTPRACAPYRARTKGKDERGVGYVKHNAIAGHAFTSWAALEAHLAWWMREIADVREHGTTGEAPLARFDREEAAALRPLEGRPPFRQVRDLVRRVSSDCCVEVDTNAYSVPWRLIGETVRVVVAGGRVAVEHGGPRVAGRPENHNQVKRLEVYDLAGALHFDPTLPFPALASRDPGLAAYLSQEAGPHFSAEGADNLEMSPGGDRYLVPEGEAVSSQWLDLVSHHPWLWLRVRSTAFLATFLATFLTARRLDCPMVVVGVDGEDPDLLRNTGLAARYTRKDAADERYATAFLGTPVFSHLTYALVALALLALALRDLRRGDRRSELLIVVGLLAAGLLFAGSFFLVTYACDYRYCYFLDVAAMAALVHRAALRPAPRRADASSQFFPPWRPAP